uniref:head GIN domain-containing protein n=1 Tax=uncultured Polaribacter sp. TaxID=174711 RepID=UPI00261EAE0E|nr:head GIN domain-containing protein [uncultured Polaribacter sp.]
MKSTTKKLLALLFVSVLMSSCNVNMFNRVNGNRNVVTADRSTSQKFTKIKVSTGLDLYLSQGTKNKVTLEADENLHDIIITEVNDGVLKIYSEKNIWQAKARKVYVTVKNLEGLTATSGSDVYTEDVLKVETIKVSATSGADIRIALDADTVETSATSGSDIRISGTANNHTSRANSGASIEAYKLISKNATVNVSSGADINIYASESINAKASSGGDIDFKGNPREINKKSSSGGSVSAK